MNRLNSLKLIVPMILILAFLVGCGGSVSVPTTATVTKLPELTPTPEPTPTLEPPKKLLFIGNSVLYTNDGVEHHLAELASSADPPIVIEAESSTRGGASLEGLWKFTKSAERIQNGAYDIVVLQGDIQLSTAWKESESVDSFYEYARLFDAEIKESGAETVLYMAWPFEDGFTKPITYEELVRAHRDIAAELGADVAPVALAMQRSAEERPDLDMFGGDGVHPSIYGTYLAANVVYATIYGESPEGLAYLPPEGFYMLSDRSDIDSISEEAAAFLQRVAWETVQDYQAQQ
ncbi:MAG: hypothetical protein GWP61_24265 [Chloroflexi bacterium]|nr:hypothetical protein [Chloroflexota bacterium]